ncbi:MAG: CopG family transcriptional regulator [Cyanobacteria bacterium P01_E01_bin.6]
MNAADFDRKFDEREVDITHDLDWNDLDWNDLDWNDLDLSQIKHPGYSNKQGNMEFSLGMIEALDRKVNPLDVSHQSRIKG